MWKVNIIIKNFKRLGAIKGINRKNDNANKINKILEITNSKGCEVILDCVGSSEFENVS